MLQIAYKGIEDERLGDAPFIGALIIANQCYGNCSGCFNQHVKLEQTKYNTSEEILALVRQNPINEGIILGGLEWTDQPEDMLDLVAAAKRAHLEIMIYTRLIESEFFEKFPAVRQYRYIYYKFGPYLKEYIHNNYYSYGIKLATTNQYIIRR